MHAPNVEGIVELAAALESKSASLRLRLVGGPIEAGKALADRYPIIDYLGPLDNTALETEAASWCAFVNPIFCQPRGCSTKLAVPLSWRLPIATTRAGARGYHWDESLIPFQDTPYTLAEESQQLAGIGHAQSRRLAVETIATGSPNLSELAESFRTALL